VTSNGSAAGLFSTSHASASASTRSRRRRRQGGRFYANVLNVESFISNLPAFALSSGVRWPSTWICPPRSLAGKEKERLEGGRAVARASERGIDKGEENGNDAVPNGDDANHDPNGTAGGRGQKETKDPDISTSIPRHLQRCAAKKQMTRKEKIEEERFRRQVLGWADEPLPELNGSETSDGSKANGGSEAKSGANDVVNGHSNDSSEAKEKLNGLANGVANLDVKGTTTTGNDGFDDPIVPQQYRPGKKNKNVPNAERNMRQGMRQKRDKKLGEAWSEARGDGVGEAGVVEYDDREEKEEVEDMSEESRKGECGGRECFGDREGGGAVK
jgi:hypothetical protein